MSPVVLYAEDSGLGDGDPFVSLPGTGMAVPRGIEAVFQYNGLTFNDTSLIDKYRIMNIDGLDDPDVRDSREDNVADDGESFYNAYYGGRTLALTGRVEAYELNKLRDMQQALRTAFADISREYPLYFLTGNPESDHYINVKKLTKNQWGEEQKDANRFFRDFLITVRASDPRFLRYRQNTVSIDPDDGSSFIIGNAGNFTAKPTYKIFGPMGDVEFNIESGNESKTFRLDQTVDIADGDFYLVNIARNTMVDSNGDSVFDDLDYTSDWPKLFAGQNYLTIDTGQCDVGGANAHIEVIYRDSWI